MSDILNFYRELPRWARILLAIFAGGIVHGLYRIFTFVGSKNTSTLVWGILCFVPVVGTVLWVADLVSVIMHDKLTLFVD